MARSTEEIFNGMVAKKESLASLNVYLPNGLANSYQYVLQKINSNSKVALWLLLFYVAAEAMHTLEVLWDYFRADVDAQIAKHKPGTKLWYKQQALNFQYGDQLYWIDNSYKYLIADTSKMVVAQASVKDNGGIVRIKAAKDDGNGNLQKMSSTEVDALNAYFIKIRYAGTKTVCSSFDPDAIKLKLIIRYDALVDLAALKIAVKAAIKEYLKSLPFDGNVVLSAAIDAMQKVPGVTDVVVLNFYGTYGLLPDSDCTATGIYQTNAGYALNNETYFDNNTTWEATI
ncbi:MAG: hypothetical protein BGO32_08585 [Bacteroidetes bacterium 37-13]|nr:MAG: hypothetical protein BGO32_08585 [Bacteroidetes bacterium 37-13]